MTPNTLADKDLIAATRAIVSRSHVIEADLLVHLAEVEERKLHLELAFPSMFAFCTRELGMSEDIAYNRICVARLLRRFPLVFDCVRSGRVHLSGLRILAPHVNDANCAELLAEAAGMSKRDLESLVTRFDPKPPVPTTIRKLPHQSAHAPSAPSPASIATAPASTPTPPPAFELTPPPPRPTYEPLTPDSYALTLTIDGALRKKLLEAQALMRHRVQDGELAAILDEALDVLIEQVKKERFGVGRKPRNVAAQDEVPGEGTEGSPHVSRHIPQEIKRAVYERDQGQCTYRSDEGRRCGETSALQFDHLDGFARTREHSVDRIAIKCRAHNLHAAEKMYGPAKMARMKNSLSATRAGAGELDLLF